MFGKFICSSIRNKLLIVTGLGTSLVLGAAGYGLLNAWQVEQEMSEIMHHQLTVESELMEMTDDFKTQVQEWKNVLIRGHDDTQREKYWGRFNKRHQDVQKDAALLIQDMSIGEGRELVGKFKKVHSELLPKYQKGYQAFLGSDYDHKAGDQAVKGIDREPGKMLSQIRSTFEAKVDETIAAADKRAADSLMLTITLLLIAVVVSFFAFLIMVQKNIVTPAKNLVSDFSRMAEGDFSGEISVHSGDEIGQVAESAAKVQEDIGELVNRINQSVYTLSTSAEEMAHVTEQSNQAMMQQRAETDQVATAMNEMTATVHEVAQNAQLAADSASQANSEVNTGQSVVNDAIRNIASLVQKVEQASDVIHNLENDSVEIGSVLDVIRSIAEQTNLLALNAAIEAARAGEQGRGFAVVADEVRVLAQRTQSSTEEIQAMIERLQAGAQDAVESMNQSRSQADTTRDTAAKAGEVLNSITGAVTNINDMNALIASAAEEQNAVAEEINRNIVNISQSSEHSAESAAQ